MPATRQANDSLRGYHYQFLKTIVEILDSDEDKKIIVEGIVEDIDVVSSRTTRAIQCKYHESKDKYALSIIYKPVLQMMEHFNTHRESLVEYVLFIYIASEEDIPALTDSDLDTILSSTNKKLLPLIAHIPSDFPKHDFLEQFKISKGPSLRQLEAETKKKIVENGLDINSLDELYYPNALHLIGELSRMNDASEREISKTFFVDWLTKTQATLYTKWSIVARGKKTTLSIIRKQLSAGLGNNNRKRGVIIGKAEQRVWDGVVDIITSFVGKYAYKPVLHTNEPFFLLDVEWQDYQEFLNTLGKFHSQIHCCELGTEFNSGRADQKSHYIKEAQTRDFFFKIARLCDESKKYVEQAGLNDLFIFSSDYTPQTQLPGVQLYQYNMPHANEIKYILGVRDTYE